MKSASRLFYLSLFTLWGPQVQCQSQDAPQESCAVSRQPYFSPNYFTSHYLAYAPINQPYFSDKRTFDQIEPKSIVSDACASYSTLDRLNQRIKPAVDDLTRTTDFFSHYRLNLFNKRCPFWNDENGMCGNIACAVQTLDNEEDIPEVWRASQLGKLEGPHAKHPGKRAQKERPLKPLEGKLGANVGESCVVEYDDECDDRDYCVPEDESAGSKGDYVSLLQNPERFTGYAGDGARQLWDAIYRENCFQRSSFPGSASLGKITTPKGPAAMDFKAVIEAAGRHQNLEQQRQQNPLTPFVAKTGLEYEDECLEKRVFYRVMSGMHASISTHLCWDFLNQTTGKWQPNVSCYVNRLHKFPDRISNLYFNYALLTRAIAKLGPYLSNKKEYTFCMGDGDQDAATRAKVLAVTEKAASVPQIFDESLMFKNGEGPSLKEDFRNRFRNVSRLMDCVGCDKCRLWGKLQTAGYGAALKVLFEYDNNNNPVPPVLKRTELVSLFNTYARLGSSINAIQKFRTMVDQVEPATKKIEGEEVKQDRADEKVNIIPDRVKKPHHVIVPSPSPNDPSTAPSDSVETTSSEEFEDKFPEDEEPAGGRPQRTFKEDADEEFARIYKAVRHVLKSWWSIPKTIWLIISVEVPRLWQNYIGLPVSPRTYKLERPNLDEL
ncbi:endoplasmic reticulum Oxidoreductin 1-domain-containing protein [Rhypophila decipiens]|uniref:Endoplasmic reticulum Oxidoreductin 1-domain-containing protein n=1 Tax=Rhypophila decipiens TaxID=261697 RepID=A0AAN6YIG0_9PEZI|nr:endoplasmic reticulum Oxidoreductin 1-domain-containing protein [Rhypophila decipiens]